MEKLIGNSRYINSKLDNLYTNITLNKTASLYKEEDLVRDISEYSTYVEERDKSTNFLLYGKIEFLFDPYNEYVSKDWVFEVGYPTYEYDDSSKVKFKFVDLGVIMIYNTMDINIEETLIFNKGNEYVYTKVISVENREDGLYLTINSLKDLNNFTLYIKEIKYTKKFTTLTILPLVNNGYGVNIFNNQLYQYANTNDIDISIYKGFLNEPLNEFIYRLRYVGLVQKSFKLIDEDIISKNVFDINEITHTQTDINYMWLYFNIRNITREQENSNININESGRVRESSNRTSSTRSIDNQTYNNDRSTSGNKKRINNLPDRDEVKGMLNLPQTMSMFMYNYIITNIREYGDIITGQNYSDTKLPSNVVLYDDNSYRYRELISYEENDVYPFMNNKHYIYEDLKFILARIKPISKYNPLYYIDEIDSEGISSLVNPLERRLC